MRWFFSFKRRHRAWLRVAGVIFALVLPLTFTLNCTGTFKPINRSVSDNLSLVDSPLIPAPFTAPARPELWLFTHTYNRSNADGRIDNLKRLIDQAATLGFTGVVLDDSYLGGEIISLNETTADKKAMLKDLMDYVVAKGLKVMPPTAYYGWVLGKDKNLAEGIQTLGTRFKVVAGAGQTLLQLQNQGPTLVNGAFDDAGGSDTGWSGDFSEKITGGRVSIDTATFHSAPASARIEGNPAGSPNARLIQSLRGLTPWRQYHVSFWHKTQSQGGNKALFQVLDADTPDLNPRVYLNFYNQAATQDWTRIDFTFNSHESRNVNIYLGFYGNMQGTMWIDDVAFEETGLVNLVRRGGAPLKVYDPATNEIFSEGADVAPVVDPRLAVIGDAMFYHAPPTITAPAGSRLRAGQIVAIDGYTLEAAVDYGIYACMLEPGVHSLMKQHLQLLDDLAPPGSPVFFQHDELRVMRTCNLCKTSFATAGEVLAKNFSLTYNDERSLRPATPVYVWNDMFDPYHNALDHYYLVEGTLAGSWRGLPQDVIIMNWNTSKIKTSGAFFAGLDPLNSIPHRQVIATNADATDVAAELNSEMDQMAGVLGVQGFQYTTWNAKYDPTVMANFVRIANDRWARYLQSIANYQH